MADDLAGALARDGQLGAGGQHASGIPLCPARRCAGRPPGRRLTLIAAQIWVVVAGLLLAGLAVMGWLGAWGLLALTFLIGAGTAVIFPAWAAAIPELVPRDDLVQAVALNGVGFNLARAFGPALGGVAMAA